MPRISVESDEIIVRDAHILQILLELLPTRPSHLTTFNIIHNTNRTKLTLPCILITYDPVKLLHSIVLSLGSLIIKGFFTRLHLLCWWWPPPLLLWLLGLQLGQLPTMPKVNQPILLRDAHINAHHNSHDHEDQSHDQHHRDASRKVRWLRLFK